MFSKSSSLPPEFSNALKKLTSTFKDATTQQTKLSPSIWQNSESNASLNRVPKIREIPSGNGWRWNQAKKRYVVQYDQITIELTKLVPRKAVRSHLTSLPKLKLWQGIITNNNEPDSAVYWCEKGADLTEEPELALEEYSFLSEYMSEEDSKQLWPELPIFTTLSTEWENMVELLLA